MNTRIYGHVILSDAFTWGIEFQYTECSTSDKYTPITCTTVVWLNLSKPTGNLLLMIIRAEKPIHNAVMQLTFILQNRKLQNWRIKYMFPRIQVEALTLTYTRTMQIEIRLRGYARGFRWSLNICNLFPRHQHRFIQILCDVLTALLQFFPINELLIPPN